MAPDASQMNVMGMGQPGTMGAMNPMASLQHGGMMGASNPMQGGPMMNPMALLQGGGAMGMNPMAMLQGGGGAVNPMALLQGGGGLGGITGPGVQNALAGMQGFPGLQAL